MSPAALSLVVYGAYLLAIGFGLVMVPDLSLSVVGLQTGPDAWVRIVGLLAGEIGFYYVCMGLKGISVIYIATIIGRIAAAMVFLVLAFSGIGPMQLLLFALIDSLSAIWTYFAMRKSNVA